MPTRRTRLFWIILTAIFDLSQNISKPGTAYIALEPPRRAAKSLRPDKSRGGSPILKGQLEERAVTLAQYIIENNATVRSAAKAFNISKSTVHTAAIKWNGLTHYREPILFASLARFIMSNPFKAA